MPQVYKVSTDTGRFAHVAGKRPAIQLARTLAGAPASTSLKELIEGWGVTITPITRAEARAVGR